MEGQYSRLISMLFQKARRDPAYAKMGEEYAELEERFSQMVMQLTREDQDLAWAFICQGEAMNRRMLEIICEEMQIWRSDLEILLQKISGRFCLPDIALVTDRR